MLNTSGETLLAQLHGQGELREIPLESDLPGSLRKEGNQHMRQIAPLSL